MTAGTVEASVSPADHLTYILLQMAARDLINRGLTDAEAATAFNDMVADVRAEAREKRRCKFRIVKPKRASGEAGGCLRHPPGPTFITL